MSLWSPELVRTCADAEAVEEDEGEVCAPPVVDDALLVVMLLLLLLLLLFL